jgi:hypothetical protein
MADLSVINYSDILAKLADEPNWLALDESVRTEVLKDYQADIGESIVESVVKALLPKKAKAVHPKRTKKDAAATQAVEA